MTVMEIINLVIAATGLTSGAFGLFFGLSGFFQSRAHVVSEYLAAMHDEDFLAARAYVYHQRRDLNATLSVDDELAGEVINFYHTWGCLARHGYLPMWVFKERMSGLGAVRLFELLEPLIDELTIAHNDETYANGFKWLYYKLNKIYANQEKHPRKKAKLLPPGEYKVVEKVLRENRNNRTALPKN